MRNPRNVTVLFTDLVDSTALAARLGADDADELRRTHFSLLRGAVAEHDGREVKNLGDGLMVTFGSVGSALDTAVAMQQAIDRHNRSGGEPLTIRVGIAVGDAEEEDGDLFGEPVVQAARLCAAADGGAILVPELLRHLARRGAHEFTPVGDLELKGLPEPMATAQVVWEPSADDAAIPLPARLAVPYVAEFVGRQQERERLEAAGKAARAGERRAVFIAGEAGMGKTRLVTEVAGAAHRAGAVVLYGRCDEELGIPYQPWAEALGHYLAHADDDALDRHDRAALGELTRLVPPLQRRVPELAAAAATDPSIERHLLFGAVVQLLGEIARDQLCIVVLDDLHWADRTTIQLLRQVLASLDLGAVLVVGTYRDTDLDADHPMTAALAGLHREPGVELMTLRGLGDQEVLALLGSMAGHDLAERGVELARAVRTETDGNPFFVGEVLLHLTETGAIGEQDGQRVAAGSLAEVGLPASVRVVVGERVRRLGDTAHQVLVAAAVIGREFDVDTVEAASQLDEQAVLDALDAAVSAGLVAETTSTDRFTFSHALVQHTLYDELTRARKVRLHRRVAEALEATLGDEPAERIGELANHWLAAARPADLDKAIDHARRAGDHAQAGLAFEEAARWYTQALEVLEQHGADDDLRRRCELLIQLGIAQREGFSDVPAFRESLLEAARLAEQLDDTDLLVQAVLANTRGWPSASGELDHDRIELIDKALDRLDDPDSADRARLLIISATERQYAAGIDERLALAEEAVATARRSGDDAALLYAFGRQSPIIVPWTLELRTAWSAEACELADRSSDTFARFSAWAFARMAALERADAASYWRHTAAHEAETSQLPHTVAAWVAAYFRVVDALVRGDLADAERLADEALTLGSDAGQADALAIWGAQWLNTRIFQGRFAEGVALVEQARTEMPNMTVYGAVLADAVARSGDIDRARALLDEQAADGLPTAADNTWPEAQASWADAAACTGHAATAALVRERIEPFAGQIVTTVVTIRPPFAHSLGQCHHVLGDLDRADAAYGEALAVEEHLGAPLFAAVTQAAWAALLADRDQGDDHARATELATTALAAATAGGYGDVEADARAVLERVR